MNIIDLNIDIKNSEGKIISDNCTLKLPGLLEETHLICICAEIIKQIEILSTSKILGWDFESEYKLDEDDDLDLDPRKYT